MLKTKKYSPPLSPSLTSKSEDSSDDVIFVMVEKPEQKLANKMVKIEPASEDLDTPLSEILKNEINLTTSLISESAETLEDPRLCRTPIATPDLVLDSPIQSAQPRLVPPLAARTHKSSSEQKSSSGQDPKTQNVPSSKSLEEIVFGKAKLS